MILSQDATHWAPLPELPQERHNDWSRELLLCEGVTVESRLDATPVEYSGKADQKEYYFRSRGQRWEMIIADTVDQCVEASLNARPLEKPNSIAQGATGESDLTHVICHSNGPKKLFGVASGFGGPRDKTRRR